MKSKHQIASSFDILFVGAGVSTLYTIIHVLTRLDSRSIRIGVAERSENGWGGLPYSSARSSYNALLITSLRHFLPEPERALFIEWLSSNKHWAFDCFKQHGGILSAQWLEQHQQAIDAYTWEDLYLPRYLFGEYMTQRLQQLASPHCTIELITSEVTNIARASNHFDVTLKGVPQSLRAESVVLAVGSPPNHAKLPTAPAGACFIDDPYNPGLSEALDKVEACLRASGDPSPEILLLGAAASTMDVLYSLNDRLNAIRAHYTILSPCGKLPDQLLETGAATGPDFQPQQLQALREREDLSAREIYDAASADIDRGGSLGLTTTDMLAPVSSAVDVLVARLSYSGKKDFAAHWGNAIGRLQRRAGPEYSAVPVTLAAEGRLDLIRGRFTRVEGSVVEHESAGQTQFLRKNPSVIINCAGFARIHDLPGTHLLKRLIANGLVQPTPAGTGITVNDHLEAADGLFVIGPLLAGNVIRGGPVWHLEHCGRISAFAKTLSGILEERFATVTVPHAKMKG